MQLLDLLFMSKMLNGYYKIDATEYFCLKEFATEPPGYQRNLFRTTENKEIYLPTRVLAQNLQTCEHLTKFNRLLQPSGTQTTTTEALLELLHDKL